MDEYMHTRAGLEIVRDGVKDMGKPPLFSRVPSGQGPLEVLGDKATCINFYGGPGDALCSDSIRQGREG